MPGIRPYSLLHTITNPVARMLPLQREQAMVYRMGEKYPPVGWLEGHAPTWECVPAILPAQGVVQIRVNLQRDFTLLSISTQNLGTNLNGGFRTQLYDVKKQLRLSDRGVQQLLMGGPAGGVQLGGPFFLREPYRFDLPDSQLLVTLTNLETTQNTVQLVLFGAVLRFNEPSKVAREFPGGPISSVVGG